MKQSIKLILFAVSLVLVLAVAVFGYHLLKGQFEQQQFQGFSSESGRPENQSASSDSEGDDCQETQLAPDFTVYDGEGNSVSLSDFLGKPVIVNFWATWCGYCKQEMPDFQKMYDQYGEQIVFLMVNLTDENETQQKAEEYIQREGYTFPVYFDLEQDAAYTYYLTSLPTTLVVDEEGSVSGYAKGMVSLEGLQSAVDFLLEK